MAGDLNVTLGLLCMDVNDDLKDICENQCWSGTEEDLGGLKDAVWLAGHCGTQALRGGVPRDHYLVFATFKSEGGPVQAISQGEDGRCGDLNEEANAELKRR